MANNSLQALYPSLFRISNLKNRPISDFVDLYSPQIGDSTNWTFHFSGNLLDGEIIQLQELLHYLERHRLNSGVEDCRIRLLDSSGIFSCKSAFTWLTTDISFTVNFPAKCVWKLSIPIKVKVFTWLLVLGKVGVHSNLQKRRPHHSLSPGWCVLCKKDNETLDHLFLSCDFSFRLWCKILKEFGRDWVTPRSSLELLSLGQSFFLNKKGRTLWKVATTVTFWAIWLERNKRIFEEVQESVEST